MKRFSIYFLSLFISISFFLMMSCEESETLSEEERRELSMLEDFLEINNITTPPTESGLYYIETEAGMGSQPTNMRTVKVHYTGYLLDGTIFDSSSGKDPISFVLGNGDVIDGWDEGISYMRQGGKARLIIPSKLGYGSKSVGDIPGYSTLIFDVELVSVY